jgi:WW domain-containing oxidoreductase
VEAACASITSSGSSSGGECVAMEINLSSLASVKSFAAAFREKFKRLDVFVMNAGMTFWKTMQLSPDGVESMFQVNHLSHFYLAKLLDDYIRAAPSTKIVVVSSAAHYGPFPYEPVEWTLGKLNDEKLWQGVSQGMAYYGLSKLANVLFAQELSRRLNAEQRTAFVNACAPGITKTNVTEEGRIKARAWAESRPFVAPLVEAGIAAFNVMEDLTTWSTEDGARTQIYLSMSKQVEEKELDGLYFHPQGTPVPVSKLARGSAGETLAKQLWELSERLLESKGY